MVYPKTDDGITASLNIENMETTSYMYCFSSSDQVRLKEATEFTYFKAEYPLSYLVNIK
jgi:hypothetical protein